HTITATYSGDSINAGSSGSTGVTVNPGFYAVGASAGGGPTVAVYRAGTGQYLYSFFAFDPNFTGGCRVALGGVHGDGIPDLLIVPGAGGGPNVRVFSGADGSLLMNFMAYDPTFTGGLFVAAGDLNGDGRADVITGPDAGMKSEIKAFSGLNGSTML